MNGRGNQSGAGSYRGLGYGLGTSLLPRGMGSFNREKGSGGGRGLGIKFLDAYGQNATAKGRVGGAGTTMGKGRG